VENGLEALDRASAHALGRRIGCDQIRVLRLELLQLRHQRVELGVGDFRRAQYVVALFVVPNEGPKFLDSLGGIHALA
jgi:hypothetical protein